MGLYVIGVKLYLSQVPATGRVTPTRPYGVAAARSGRYSRRERFGGGLTGW